MILAHTTSVGRDRSFLRHVKAPRSVRDKMRSEWAITVLLSYILYQQASSTCINVDIFERQKSIARHMQCVGASL